MQRTVRIIRGIGTHSPLIRDEEGKPQPWGVKPWKENEIVDVGEEAYEQLLRAMLAEDAPQGAVLIPKTKQTVA